MEIDVNWSDSQLGYVISYNVPEMYKIDPSQSNGSEKDFYELDVYWRLMSDLDAIDIGPAAIVS